jgi:DNA segregation ATPase FtsK/SpoIIIE, S-DNA-T family
MLKTDDAPVLSKLAAGTDWLIFAAPGPLGLISPKTINNTLQFVGRANMGNYGLYAYAANNLFPVRRHFEEYFRKTPVATLPAERMVDLLVTKAQESGNAVLFSSLGSVAAQVAALVALEIAQEDVKPGDQLFVLNLDDMGWTRAWLLEGSRADFLIVLIKSDDTVIFRIVESKSKEFGDAIPCDSRHETFTQGLSQVTHTLEAIKEITDTRDPSLDEDLRFASLIEHLMAAVLSKSVQLLGTDRKRVFDIVNELSRRDKIPSFEALVVLTQAGVNKPRSKVRINDETSIIWAGVPDVNRTFRISSETNESGATPAGQPDEVSPELLTEVPSNEPSSGEPGDLRQDEAVDTNFQSFVDVNTELARGFIAAARIHGIAIASSDPVYIQVGPALFAVGILLKEGAAIQPLRARLSDIARDVGLGDRANEIEVENDERARTVRVMLPRLNREYPSLPRQSESLVSADGYLPLFIGQTVAGKNYSKALESWPHMLVAGTTGSGKTTFLKSLLRQLDTFSAQRLQVVVVDGKGDTDYLGLLSPNMYPGEFPEVQLGHPNAIPVLQWTMQKMEERRQAILDLARKANVAQGIKAADLYRTALKERRVPEIAPLILVIDEFADIMLAGKKSADEFENLVQRVSQVGRSRLIHLVLATQRPDKETIRGAIKANLNARAVFRLPTQADSLTVLGQAGAEKLMLHGDMLFQHGTGAPLRLQGYSV